MSRVADANRAFEQAQQKIADAEHARDEARERLEGALAEHGWRRLVGAFAPDATALYTNPVYGTTLDLEQVLEALEQQARAAA